MTSTIRGRVDLVADDDQGQPAAWLIVDGRREGFDVSRRDASILKTYLLGDPVELTIQRSDPGRGFACR